MSWFFNASVSCKMACCIVGKDIWYHGAGSSVRLLSIKVSVSWKIQWRCSRLLPKAFPRLRQQTNHHQHQHATHPETWIQVGINLTVMSAFILICNSIWSHVLKMKFRSIECQLSDLRSDFLLQGCTLEPANEGIYESCTTREIIDPSWAHPWGFMTPYEQLEAVRLKKRKISIKGAGSDARWVIPLSLKNMPYWE